jgi:Do/DeqQ family serine protease
MKVNKYLLNVLLAIVGGLIALFAYTIVIDKNQVVRVHDVKPTWFTALPEQMQIGEMDFVFAAEKSIHSVVHVMSTTMRQSRPSNPLWDFFHGVPDREPSPVVGFGSGVIISPDGYIVTNYHVIENARSIEVVLNDRRSFEAQLIGTDPSTDLALLKIQEKDLPFLPMGDSDDLRVGQWVLAVGNPFNLTSTVTAGIVSAKGRSLGALQNRNMPIESFIQTDAAVNRGNSGGALINLRAELVGINTLIISPTQGYSGNSFAIPVNMVKKVVEDLKEFGEVQRALLGVTIQDVNARLADSLKLGRIEGVYVAGVSEEGAAKSAGIREGDVILKIRNVPVNSVAEVQEQISRYRPNDKIQVSVKRKNKTQQFDVTLRNLQGTTTVVHPQEAFLGAKFNEVPADLKRELRIQSGVQINELAPGKFSSAGVREGFIITRVNSTSVDSVDEIRSILEGFSGGVFVEGIYPNGTTAYYAFGM